MQEHIYGPGEIIFHEGDIPENLYILIRGTVSFYKEFGELTKSKVTTKIIEVKQLSYK
jgi:CRP-like cAMP-binding protein